MRGTTRPFGYIAIHIPIVLSFLSTGTSSASYWISWFGSWFILYASLSGMVKPLPGVNKWTEMILRPLALTQIIFVGYMALSSVFHFLELHGYFYLQRDYTFVTNPNDLKSVAQVQRYYLLGHTALATGMLLFMDYRTSGLWRIRSGRNLPRFLFLVSIGSLIAGSIVSFVPGVEIIVPRFQMLSVIASAAGVAFSFREKEQNYLLATLVVYSASVFNALGTGWKEPVLIAFIILAVYFYNFYKTVVVLVSPVVFTVLILILPTYVNTVRQLSWTPDSYYDRSEVVSTAFDQIQNDYGEESFWKTNWNFLTGRISEASIFQIYVEHVPSINDFYGWQIPKQVFISLVPGIIWPTKPNIERMVMERVYENNVVDRNSKVSAKPQYVADAYLMAGVWGIYFSCFVFGVFATLASRLCERWFGGYLIGSGLIYTSVFINFWRGNAFEFFYATMVWNFVLIFMLFAAGRATKILVRREESTGLAPSRTD